MRALISTKENFLNIYTALQLTTFKPLYMWIQIPAGSEIFSFSPYEPLSSLDYCSEDIIWNT